MAVKGLLQFLFEQGSKPDNLLRLGFLTPESLANPSAVKTAQTKYKKSLENPAVAAREEGRLLNSPVINQGALPERKIIRPEDVENTILVSHKGDTSSTDTELLEMAGIKFDNPPESRGGVRFGDSPKTPEELYWASMATGAVPLQNKAEGLMATFDMPVTGVFGSMGDEAMFFNDAISDTMLQWTQKLQLPKKAIAEFDADMRKTKKDWVGINHPDARDQLLGVNGYPREGAGKFRSRFAARMSMAGYRDLGFPSIGDVKSVYREPDLANTNLGDSGYVMGKIGQGYGLTKDTNHLSYDTGIMGEGIGGFEQSLPNRIAYPDAYKKLENELTKPKDPTKTAPRLFTESEKVDAIGKRKDLFQIADARWVDTASKWLEDNKGATNAALIAAVGLPAVMQSEQTEAGPAGLLRNAMPTPQAAPVAMTGILGAGMSDESDASLAKLAARGLELTDMIDPKDSRVGEYFLSEPDSTKSIGVLRTDSAVDSGFDDGYMASQLTEIDPEYRRQGLAGEMYAAAEELSGNKLVPSTTLSPDGAAMWNSRDRGLLEQVQQKMGSDNYATVEDVLNPDGMGPSVQLKGFDRKYAAPAAGLLAASEYAEPREYREAPVVEKTSFGDMIQEYADINQRTEAAEDQKFDALMREDARLREMGSASFGKLSPELAAYRRSQILPAVDEIGMGVLGGAVDSLDFLSQIPSSIASMRMPERTPLRDRLGGLLDYNFMDKRNQKAIDEARFIGGLLSPI
tara:strand:+ start:74 stop:2305 length:2232 start_codon:yes stop_codon:yes gene_type:complete